MAACTSAASTSHSLRALSSWASNARCLTPRGFAARGQDPPWPGSSGDPPALERPPQLDQHAWIAQRRSGRLLEATEAMAKCVRVHVQHARGLVDAHLLIEPGAQ